MLRHHRYRFRHPNTSENGRTIKKEQLAFRGYEIFRADFALCGQRSPMSGQRADPVGPWLVSCSNDSH